MTRDAKQRVPRIKGSIFKFKGSNNWWIKYYVNGERVLESSGSDDIAVAQKLLAQRNAELLTDTWNDPKKRKITVADLYHALETDYRINAPTVAIGADKATRAERRWKARLEKHFGHIRARALTTDTLNKYVVWAQGEGLTNATINRDMAALRRAFYLAQEAGKIERVPKFPHLTEANPRSGFVEEAQFRKLISNAKELWLRALVTTAYTFGWRKSELLNLRCKQVSLTERTITLNPGETKNDEGRWVPLEEDLFVLLHALLIGKKGTDFVFTRNDGSRVRDYRDDWTALCKAADLPDLLFHDLRRSGVRNMIRRGVQQKIAMLISGHKTPSVFQRYNIIDETDIRLAVQKIAAGAKVEQAKIGQSVGRVAFENGATTLQIPAPKILPD